jgi:hypothetical protein
MSYLAPGGIDVLGLPSLPLAKRGELPNTAAIYFVLSGTDNMLYIGRTKKLCLRLVAHQRLGDFKKSTDVRVAYLSVTDSTLLPSIEKAMIAYFDPPLNRSRVASMTEYQPITIRLPVYIMEEMRDVAEAEDRSLNQQVVRVVKSWYVERRKQLGESMPRALADGSCPACTDAGVLPHVPGCVGAVVLTS